MNSRTPSIPRIFLHCYENAASLADILDILELSRVPTPIKVTCA